MPHKYAYIKGTIMNKQLEIFYLSNVLKDDYFSNIKGDLNGPGWKYGPVASAEGFEEDNISMWVYDFLKSPWNPVLYQSILDKLREVAPATSNYQFKILESYAGGKTFGIDGKVHNDKEFTFNEVGDGFMTFCFFPSQEEWDPNWGGELQFFDDNLNVIATYHPQPNTCLVFDSNIPHRGLAPSKDCPYLRTFISIKTFVHKRWDLEETSEVEVSIKDVSSS
jgi:hypothetical protein